MFTPCASGMASTLSYTGITSLDGFINDDQGHFHWSAPEPESAVIDDYATLAAEAIRAGLVDEFRMLVNPIIVGGGTPYFPPGVTVALDLVEQRRFDSGVVFLRYRRR